MKIIDVTGGGSFSAEEAQELREATLKEVDILRKVSGQPNVSEWRSRSAGIRHGVAGCSRELLKVLHPEWQAGLGPECEVPTCAQTPWMPRGTILSPHSPQQLRALTPHPGYLLVLLALATGDEPAISVSVQLKDTYETNTFFFLVFDL